jgi:chromate transporter
MWEQLEIFLIFLKDSALAFSGLAALPQLRADLVPRFVSDAAVLQSLAIGRLAPGPNGLFIVSLGYLVAGWSGALYAFVAACAAPLVMLPATTLARRWLLSAWFGGLVRGVTLATAGLLLATGVTIVQTGGTEIWQLVLGAVTLAITLQGKVHPGVMIGVGGAIGLLLGR